MGDIQDQVAAGVPESSRSADARQSYGLRWLRWKAIEWVGIGFLPEWSLVLQREQILLPVPVASCQCQTLAIKQAQSPGVQRDICIERESTQMIHQAASLGW